MILLTVVGVSGVGCDTAMDSMFCSEAGCAWPEQEWRAVSALAAPSDWTPPVDRTNKYFGNDGAEKLGQKFYFETRFSGVSEQRDVLRRWVPAGQARAERGKPTNLSCASCHNLARTGVDLESVPGNISSIGSAWADTNALPVFNAAFYAIQYWSGRADSLWAQAINSNEGQNMNGNRLATAWLLYDKYRAEYNAVATDAQLPQTMEKSAVTALVEADGTARAGQCKLNPACPTDCREVRNADTGATGCFPRFPLQGKPGTKAGCQPGDTAEPFGDAFDCMADDDKEAITKVLVAYAKMVAAYEYTLISKGSAFDQWVESVKTKAPRPAAFTPAAERGAKLFVGKAACVDCHNTPLFSDSQFHNVGVAQIGPGVPTEADCPAGSPVCDCVTEFSDHMGANCLPWGATEGLWKLRRHQFRRDSKWSDDPNDRKAAHLLTVDLKKVPRGGWRTPTLRDVALTAPYMHNGVIPTLEAVVAHYDGGGSANTVGVRSAQIKPLLLSPAEKSDLVEFMKSLTGAPLPAELISPPELPQ